MSSKASSKILLIIFSSLFVFQISSLLVLVLSPVLKEVQAQEEPQWHIEACRQACIRRATEEKIDNPEGECDRVLKDLFVVTDSTGMGECYGYHPPIKLQVPIPFIGETVQDLTDYIAGGYKFVVGAAAILATVMIMVGGYQWLFAAGNPERIKGARETIVSALIGLVLALTSYTILHTINPRLVELTMPKVPLIRGIEQGTMWCEDNIRELEEKDLTPKITIIEDKNILKVNDCGDKAEIEGYGECTFKTCFTPDEVTFCVSKYDTKEGLTFSCKDAKKWCEDYTDRNLCEETDKALEAAGQKKFSCRERVEGGGLNSCEYYKIWLVKEDQKRIQCKEGGEICYDRGKGKPKDYCSDDERANECADDVCVMLYEKKKIDCRPWVGEDTCHSDEAEVSCEEYNPKAPYNPENPDPNYVNYESGGMNVKDIVTKELAGCTVQSPECWCPYQRGCCAEVKFLDRKRRMAGEC